MGDTGWVDEANEVVRAETVDEEVSLIGDR